MKEKEEHLASLFNRYAMMVEVLYLEAQVQAVGECASAFSKIDGKVSFVMMSLLIFLGIDTWTRYIIKKKALGI